MTEGNRVATGNVLGGVAATASLIFAITFVCLACESSQSEGDDRPNIIFVMTDDQHPAAVKHMPNMQADIKAKGVTFENMINTYPLCCPSRATLQRGQYAHNTGVLGNTKKQGGGYPTFDERNLERSTVATWLNDAGYRTVHIGKYMNQFNVDTPAPPGWDIFEKRVRLSTTLPEGFSTADSFIAHQAARRLEEATSDEDPFYLQVGFIAPHTPNQFEPRYANKFKDEQVPRTPAYNEKNVEDKPPYIRGRKPLRKQINQSVDPSCQDDESNSIQHNDCEWIRALRGLQTVDAFLGKAISHLRTQGELDNTYIVFYTDNGNHWGEHRLDYGKLSPYETDINFPLFVRGPGVPEGKVSAELIGNHDLAPTFAEIAGATTPSFVDGTSFSRLLDSDGANDEPWRDTLFVERAWQDEWENPQSLYGSYHIPPYEAVRQQESIYVRYKDTSWTDKPHGGFEEYYDLDKDPYQLNNKAFYDTVPTQRLDELKKTLKALKDCQGAECRMAEGFPAQ